MGLCIKRRIGDSVVVNNELEIVIMGVSRSGTEVKLLFLGDPDKWVIKRNEILDKPLPRKIDANGNKA